MFGCSSRRPAIHAARKGVGGVSANVPNWRCSNKEMDKCRRTDYGVVVSHRRPGPFLSYCRKRYFTHLGKQHTRSVANYFPVHPPPSPPAHAQLYSLMAARDRTARWLMSNLASTYRKRGLQIKLRNNSIYWILEFPVFCKGYYFFVVKSSFYIISIISMKNI